MATANELGTLSNPEKLWCGYPVFSPDGKTLATMTMGEWNRQPYRDGKRVTDGTDIQMKRSDQSSSGMGGASGVGLLSMNPVYEVHVWDVATRQKRKRFVVSWQGIGRGAVDMCFGGDGRSVYTLSTVDPNIISVRPVNYVQAWEVATGAAQGSIGDHGTRFHALAFTSDGHLLAATDQQLNLRRPDLYDGLYKVRIWDMTRQQEIAAPQVFTAIQLPLNLDPKSLSVASNTPPGPDAWSNEFTFGSRGLHESSADGKVQAVWSSRGIELINLVTGNVLHVLKGNEIVTRMAFSPDGKTLAVGQHSGKIQLWNVAAGRLMLTLPGHAGSVNGLAFRADGRVLASCSDNEIRLWHAATDEEVARRKP